MVIFDLSSAQNWGVWGGSKNPVFWWVRTTFDPILRGNFPSPFSSRGFAVLSAPNYLIHFLGLWHTDLGVCVTIPGLQNSRSLTTYSILLSLPTWLSKSPLSLLVPIPIRSKYNSEVPSILKILRPITQNSPFTLF